MNRFERVCRADVRRNVTTSRREEQRGRRTALSTITGWMLLGTACTFPDVTLADGAGASTSTSSNEPVAASSSGMASSAALGSSSSGTSSAGGSGGDEGGAAPSSSSGAGGMQPTSGSSASSAGASGGGGAGGGEPPLLGVASSFAILGGTTVTNAGATTITGDLGVSPGTSITGFPPGVLIGINYEGGPIAVQAQADAAFAYSALMVPPCDETYEDHELGGLDLAPGNHCFVDEAVQLTGELTLDAAGDPDAVFVFRIRAALSTSMFASVTLVNEASACNVYWLVGTSATVGDGTFFKGNILAKVAVTLSTTARLEGRAIARAALALDTNLVSVGSCAR